MILAGACAAQDGVWLGMSRAGVVERLGQPDRKAVLLGKELRDIDRLPPEQDVAGLRLVYIYDTSGLQVWFKDDKVTGVTRHGVWVY